jgi:hypothetical protein
MAKNRPDLIRDAHEHVNHNFNPYYWFNKVDSVELAKMRAGLALSVIEFIVVSIALLFSIIAYLSDYQSLFLYVIGLSSVFWVILFLRSKQWYKIRRNQAIPQVHPKERKKKLPKRPKNYGRD